MALTMASPTATTTSTSLSLLHESPHSPASPKSPTDPVACRTSNGSSLGPPHSPYPQNVDPSPVDSNGTASTDATDIDDAPQDAAAARTAESSRVDSASPLSPGSLGKLDTSVAGFSKSNTDPQSVIHAPQHFKDFNSENATKNDSKVTESPSERSDHTVVSPQTPEAKQTDDLRRESIASPLNTDIPAQIPDRSTPRAQTIQEAEAEWSDRKQRGMNLEGIPENQIGDHTEDEELDPQVIQARKEQQVADEQFGQIATLKTTLTQCWILCNTLANLSSSHRSRIFSFRGKCDVQEQAWRSCWRLCQNLYESRDDDHVGMVLPTLEMCRDFCQALFDARQRGDPTADSVLRVSFELNNHLYNTHDRNLPSAFQERTLDFYLTLCHRLMKQRTSLPQETDSLLRACWSLAELLFSIRQNKREGKDEDEELLGSAVQACWDLCDLFREGWSQVRPDRERGTPRPNQGSFSSTQQPPTRSQSALASHTTSPPNARPLSSQSYRDPKTFPPETPTTIFDDDNETLDPEDEPDNIPNILVLGPEQANPSSALSQTSSSSPHPAQRWSSSASSTVSGVSESSQHTSSTATASSSFPAEANLNRIRILLLKAATNAGFQLRPTPPSPPPPNTTPAAHTLRHLQTQNQALTAFVRALPNTTFGPHPTQSSLLDKYRKLVIHWARVVDSGTSSSSSAASSSKSGTPGAATADKDRDATKSMVVTSSEKRVSAAEVARAVQWMMRSEKNTWLRDLFRRVFGCAPDEAAGLTGHVMF